MNRNPLLSSIAVVLELEFCIVLLSVVLVAARMLLPVMTLMFCCTEKWYAKPLLTYPVTTSGAVAWRGDFC
jgi:hypothetical protein